MQAEGWPALAPPNLPGPMLGGNYFAGSSSLPQPGTGMVPPTVPTNGALPEEMPRYEGQLVSHIMQVRPAWPIASKLRLQRQRCSLARLCFAPVGICGCFCSEQNLEALQSYMAAETRTHMWRWVQLLLDQLMLIGMDPDCSTSTTCGVWTQAALQPRST